MDIYEFKKSSPVQMSDCFSEEFMYISYFFLFACFFMHA